MTYIAQSYYIKAMFEFVTVMMIAIRLIATNTCTLRRCWHCTFTYHYFDGVFCFISFWTYLPVYCTEQSVACVVLFISVSVLFVRQIRRTSTIWRMYIVHVFNFGTFFTQTSQFVWRYVTFIEFRDRFVLFAHSTFFCYDWLRHFCSFQQICLEPVVGYTPSTGLFYYSECGAIVNKNNIILGD